MAKKTEAAPASVDPKWQAEDDARSLTRAQEVRCDCKRHKAACNHLKKQAKDAKGALSLEQKVAKGLKEVFSDSEES